jgi:hypothetical protein
MRDTSTASFAVCQFCQEHVPLEACATNEDGRVGPRGVLCQAPYGSPLHSSCYGGRRLIPKVDDAGG